MPNTPLISKEWKDRLQGELGRDKRKTLILAALLLVGGVIGGRLAITHSVPGEAAATPAPGPADRPVRDDGHGPGGAWGSGGKGADRSRLAEYLANMDRTIERDLFRPNPDYFPPQPGAEPAAVEGGQADPGWFGLVERRVAQKQRENSGELARIKAIRARAGGLSLQSTMLGRWPTALINGQVLHQGDYVSGFRVTRIASNSCVVAKDGVEVELRMKK